MIKGVNLEPLENLKLPGKISGKYLLKLITKGLINEGKEWSNLINLKLMGHLEIEKWK